MAKFRRREFLYASGATLAGLAGLSLVGCGSPAKGPGGSGGSASGKLIVWDWGGNDDQSRQAQMEFQEAFKKAYPKIDLQMTLFGYTDYLEKLRLAVRGSDAPDVARIAIAWVPEFVDTGRFVELDLPKFGLTKDNFFPGALPVAMREGKFMTFPTNNEVMMMAYNKKIFKAAGLDPEKAPDTWEEVIQASKTINQKTGKFGFGMVARLNHGNTPFRFAPVMWAYGGGILDEADASPKYKEVRINNEGTVKALSVFHQMYGVDKSVSPTAITDSQNEVNALFLNGQVAMMICHASDALRMKTDNADLDVGGAMIPKGPVRRAGVFGGSNIGMTKQVRNVPAAIEFIKFYMDPEWNTKLLGDGSNPGNKEGLKSKAQAERVARNPYMKVYGEMLPFGVVPPQVPALSKIWNELIPTMLQETITGKKTAKQAADDAAKEVQALLNA